LSFGTYNPGSSSSSSATIDVGCDWFLDQLPSFSMRLSKGASATYAPRTMIKAANTLQYNIYTNSGRTTVWGDGTAGTSTISYTDPFLGGVNSISYTAYGFVPSGQLVSPGAYSDTVVVSVVY